MFDPAGKSPESIVLRRPDFSVSGLYYCVPGDSRRKAHGYGAYFIGCTRNHFLLALPIRLPYNRTVMFREVYA